MLVWHILLLLGLLYVLGMSASLITKSVSRLAQKFKTSDFIVSFFIVGLATSTPEITVAINSALRQVPELSLGNLLGASIVLLSLLVGLAAILAGRLSIRRFLNNSDFLIYLILVTLPALVVIDGRLTRWDGVFLIGAYLFFMHRLYSRRHLYQGSSPDSELSHPERFSWKKELGKLVLGLALILVAAYYAVNSALVVAGILQVSPLIIGLLLLSIGTNLPEFVLVMTQSYKRSRNIVLGDLLSNVCLNVPTLGLLALILPFTVSLVGSITVAAVFLVVSATLFGLFMWSKSVLNRTEGAVLFLLYLVYAAYNLIMTVAA